MGEGSRKGFGKAWGAWLAVALAEAARGRYLLAAIPRQKNVPLILSLPALHSFSEAGSKDEKQTLCSQPILRYAASAATQDEPAA